MELEQMYIGHAPADNEVSYKWVSKGKMWGYITLYADGLVEFSAIGDKGKEK